MLEKFIRIENVGRFIAPDCSGDPRRFAKLTLIFGENGRGKSTLAEIFRSLANGEPSHILERKTTWTTNSANVQLFVGGKVRTFKDGAWKDGACDFLIFDATFVNNSVYAGQQIGIEHRRNLYEFLIGEEAVKLAKEVEGLTAQCTAALAPIKGKELALKALHAGMPLEAFLSLAKDDQVESKIEGKRQLISQLKRSDEIKKASELKPINFVGFDVQALRDLTAKNVAQVSQHSATLLLQHLDNHVVGDTEAAREWLRQGTEYAKAESCPYCGQDVKNVDIVKAYAETFSDAYNAFIEALDIFEIGTARAFSDTAKSALEEKLSANANAITYWQSVLDKDVDWALPAIGLVEDFPILDDRIARILNSKRANPLSTFLFTQEDEELVQKYEAEVANLRRYDEVVATLNTKIQAHKASLKVQGLPVEEGALAQLELVKKRHEVPTVALCNDYSTASSTRKSLEKQKEEKRVAMKPVANALLKAHQTTINDYLEKFGASFKIVQVEAEVDHGKSSSSFAIELGNKVIQLDAKTGVPCFRSALSEGDKRTLALAVFLARVQKEPNPSTLRVVFDDPVTSLDAHRAQHVIEEIKDLVAKTKQVIVMSHQKHFLASLLMRNDIADVRVLKIARKGAEESTFEAWDYDRETENDFFQNYRRLIEFRDGTAPHALLDVAKAMRPVLEGTLKMRFPNVFGVKTMVGQALEVIAKAKADMASAEALAGLHLFEPHCAELTKLNEYARDFHHDQNGGKAIVEPDDASLRSYVKRTVKFAQGPF